MIVLSIPKPKKIEQLRKLCERLYIAELQEYVVVGKREIWCETLAKFVYTGFYLEHLGLENYVQQYVYYELAKPFRFQYAEIKFIDPVLAHILIRVRCAVVATYGLEQASHYYAPEMSRAYNTWIKQCEDRLRAEERIIAELQQEREFSTLSYGLLENFSDYVDME
ncbi:MAG: hypothetical protein ACYDER_03430 [Ktedonobacteraceae bacterium]